MDADFLEEIRATVERLWEEEGENAGSEFRKEPGARRLANLVDKGEVFERVVSHPRVLEAVRHVLGDDFKLSSLNARSTDPWWPECQPLHCDARRGSGRFRFLGVQHHLAARRFHRGERRHAHRARARSAAANCRSRRWPILKRRIPMRCWCWVKLGPW